MTTRFLNGSPIRRAAAAFTAGLIATVGLMSSAVSASAQPTPVVVNTFTGSLSSPSSVALSTNGARAYVTNYSSNTVSIVDAANGDFIGMYLVNTPRGAVVVERNGVDYLYVTSHVPGFDFDLYDCPLCDGVTPLTVACNECDESHCAICFDAYGCEGCE